VSHHVLILGATSDIAQALAYEFASHGYSLTLAARQPSRLVALVSDIQIRHNVAVKAVAFEALDYIGHAAFYNHLEPKPDVVICVFGYLGRQAAAQSDFEEAVRIIQTNYTGAMSILNVVANDFEQRRSGTIIGLSSVAGDRGRQSNYLYGSAKAGLTAYLSGLRNRLFKANVRVITVRPGFVQTRMTAAMSLPGPLTATPQQVARVIFKAYQRNRDNVYVLPVWQYIMLVIRHLPEFIFKRLNL
jgi:decaprenylphospho-beta-D-erythro-pentofuranosid-2-ulose 2-reductase